MEPTLTKVAKCLYRNAHGTYFALLKVRGMQIKRSLKTKDATLARRRLAELRPKVQGLSGDEKTMAFAQIACRPNSHAIYHPSCNKLSSFRQNRFSG